MSDAAERAFADGFLVSRVAEAIAEGIAANWDGLQPVYYNGTDADLASAIKKSGIAQSVIEAMRGDVPYGRPPGSILERLHQAELRVRVIE